MALITLNIDEDIYQEVIAKLEEFPENKIQINQEAIIEEKFDDIDLDEQEHDDEEDYFMFIEDDDSIMNYEVEIIEDIEYDDTREVQITFENGRKFFAYYSLIDEVSYTIEEEDYYFSGFIIVKEITETIIRVSIEELIYNEEFYDAFEEVNDEDNQDQKLRNIDPIRRN